MRRYGWFLGIGAVLLCVLAWIVVGRPLTDDETRLGPPIVVPSATATTEPSNEPTLEETQTPQSPSGSPPAGSTNGDSANGDSTGAERITPAPPRHAGDDEDDDDRDESDDADDDSDDDDAYDEDDDHDDAEDDDEDDDDD